MKDKNGHEFKEGDALTFHFANGGPPSKYRCVRTSRGVLGYSMVSAYGTPFGEGDSCGHWEIASRADGHPPGPVMPDGHEVRPGDVIGRGDWWRTIKGIGKASRTGTPCVLYSSAGYDYDIFMHFESGHYKLVSPASPAREVLKLDGSVKFPLLEWDGKQYAPLRIDVSESYRGRAELTVVAEEVCKPKPPASPKCVDKHGIELKVGDSVIDHHGEIREVLRVELDHIVVRAIGDDPCDQTFMREGLASRCELVPVDSQGKRVKVGDRVRNVDNLCCVIAEIHTATREVMLMGHRNRDPFDWVSRITLAPLTKAERIAEARKASDARIMALSFQTLYSATPTTVHAALQAAAAEGERIAAEIAAIEAE